MAALNDQTVQLEVIVIDSSSSDDTVAVAESLGAVAIVINAGDFDHGGTRTLAAKRAEGDIQVYLSQDSLPADRLAIENLIRPFGDIKVGAAFGRQVPHPGATPFGAHLREFNYPETSFVRTLEDRKQYGIKTPFLSNAFAAYRRSALEEVGWFRERLIMGEDTCAGAMLLLAGYKIAYAADAVVCHSHNFTASEEFRRYFDIGVFHAQEDWLLREFGKAEGEGMAYIRSGARFLSRHGKQYLLPEFFFRTILKYTGYTLGRHAEKIPFPLRKKMSMHRGWWAGSYGKK